jgi:hypothetical protein
MPSPKRCHYCGRDYQPDPRTAAMQKSCSRAACSKARRHQAQSHYVAVNPDIFQNRYPKTRQWLAEHPGYLRRYRAKHPDYVVADYRSRVERRRQARRQKSDIQDVMRRRKIEEIRALRGSDMQDTIRRQLDGVLTFLGRPALSDIQDAIGIQKALGVS